MPRFYIAPEQIRQDRAEINGAEARHILRVLRLGKGDELELFDGMGGLWKARIENVERGRLVAKLLEQRSHKTESPLKITLVQALIKADKLELIIKGAAELGASHIVILRTARARRVITSDFEHRLIRWRKLLKQAAKQCGRARLPQIEFFCWEEFWRCEIIENHSLGGRAGTRYAGSTNPGCLFWEKRLTRTGGADGRPRRRV